jgi:phosphomannomutase
MVSADFAERPVKKLVLFDVDGTLTPARQVIQHPDDYHT